VDALILAAGRGSRLRPYTDRAPKCLTPFAGRPLIEWQRAALQPHATRLHVAVGYQADALAGSGLQLWPNPEWARTNMVYTMLCARDLLQSSDGLILAYGDVIYEPRVVDALVRTPGDVVVCVDRRWLDLWRARFDDVLADAESLKLGPDGRLIDIGRRVQDVAEIEAQYMGLLRFTRAGLRALLEHCDAARDTPSGLGGLPVETAAMTDLVRGMIEANVAVHAAPVDGGWLEFDSVRDIELYESWRSQGTLDRFFSPWLPLV
jgi:choline kinase